ncbi:hypothetical protein CKO51_00155 [Rhodopirellula sp. SM50]|nr:methyltransferase regulatory domain-containing protein [Rhodopirellula sp. SM50]PAY21521.1 hypothetical protein CKO51_00155 [Rhodopirellula sp. SM50]
MSVSEDPAVESASSSYDRVPYTSWPYANSHPNRLATIGHLLGVPTPPLDRMRVLELGCASGGNLIPMAEMFSGGTFLGVDASSRQIGQGRDRIQSLGLDNIELLNVQLQDLEKTDPPFDYIITHGVYSWVPPNVQESILRISRDWLSPHGVAYISYNTNPGWKMRGMIRDMLGYHCESFDDPSARVHQARALLQFLTGAADSQTAYGAFLKEESELFARVTDDYLFHDHLEGHNEALYFHEFVRRARDAGLSYLGEPYLFLMATRNFPDDVEQTLQRVATDTIDVEQYMDFLRNRSFRMTLLVRSDQPVDRTIEPKRLKGLYVCASLTRVTEDRFELPTLFDCGERRIEALDPATSECFAVLAERWPHHLQFESLVEQVEQRLQTWPHIAWQPPDDLADYIGEHLIHCAVGNLVHLHAHGPKFVTEITEKPMVSQWPRLQACDGERVTNQKHEIVSLDDPARWLLSRLDGTKTIEELAAELTERVEAGEFEWENAEPGDHSQEAVRAYLRQFRDGALLQPEPA